MSRKSPKKPDDADNEASGRIIVLDQASVKAGALREARREAKAANLQKRFNVARKTSQSQSAAATKLKKLFKPGAAKPKK